METPLLILGACTVIILSYFFNIISKKTRIPTVLMLMGLGFGLKYVVPFEEHPLLTDALSFLGTIGVILIVLEASLDLKLKKENLPILLKALVLSFVLLIATTGLIALCLGLIVGMTTFEAIEYALPLSVMSSAIIIPSVGGLAKHKKEFLIYESAFSDIIGIILFYFLIDLSHADSIGGATVVLGGKLLLTMVLSVAVCYVLIIIFQQIKAHEKIFLLIAILIGLYATGKLIHLSPLIMIMIFGLMLNNKELFFGGKMNRFLQEEGFDSVVKEFRLIVLESAFVVRTFFFVAFGMSIALAQLGHWVVFAVSIFALIAIYATRYAGLYAFQKQDIMPELLVAPRGLITVLLFYQIPAELQSDKFEPGILLLTIIVTSIVMTYGLVKYADVGKTVEAPVAEGAAENVVAEGGGNGTAPQGDGGGGEGNGAETPPE